MFTVTKRITASVALACLGSWLAVCGPARAVPTWLGPTDLSPPGAFLTSTSVAADSAGQVTAVWNQSTGAGQFVVAAEHPNSGGWETPVYLSAQSAQIGGPQVVVDPQGDATAVWSDESVVKTAVRPAGGTWGTPVILGGVINSNGPDYVPIPWVAVNAADQAAAVWDSYGTNNTTVEVAVRSANGSWGTPVDLGSVGSGLDPRVVIDGQGNATAVWNVNSGTQASVLAATRPAGGTWSTPVQLSAADEFAVSPQVAVDAQGDATVVWVQDDGNSHIVQATVRPAGGPWQSPVDVSAVGESGVDPQLAVDAQGDATVVWDHYDGAFSASTVYDVQTAVRPAGGAWQTPADLSTTSTLRSDPQVTVNARGDAIATWDLGDPAPYYYHTAQAAVRPAGGAWQAPVALAPTDMGYETPVVALDEQGNATAIWHHSLGESTALQAAGYDVAGPRLLGLSIPVSGTVGVPVSFAVSPLDAWSPIATTNWSFGDGQTATDEIVSHTYTKPGTYTVGVSSSDTLANTTNTTATITIAPAAGTTTNPAGTEPPPTTLTLTDVSQTHRKWREGTRKAALTRTKQKPSPVGTSFAFTVNETAEVTLAFTQTAAGRRVSGKCQPATRHDRKDPRCRRTLTRGTLSYAGTAGRHRLAFQGHVTTRRLPLGDYTVTLTAASASGQRSRPHILRFTIVR
jgi:hypothetical protein